MRSSGRIVGRGPERAATFARPSGHLLGPMRKLLLIPLTVALLALTPAMAGSRVGAPPRGFFGMSPQGATGATDYELMAEAGVETVRLPMNWADLAPKAAERFDPNWSLFDEQVALAAE